MDKSGNSLCKLSVSRFEYLDPFLSFPPSTILLSNEGLKKSICKGVDEKSCREEHLLEIVEGIEIPVYQEEDPFTPPEPALFVSDVPPSHYAVLNKFCVVEGHMIVLPKVFASQSDFLCMADLEACYHLFQSICPNCVGFFNQGPSSGASQPHKHVQLIPLYDCRTDGGDCKGDCEGDREGVVALPWIEVIHNKGFEWDATHTIPFFEFRHFFGWIGGKGWDQWVSCAWEMYERGLKSLGYSTHQDPECYGTLNRIIRVVRKDDPTEVVGEMQIREHTPSMNVIFTDHFVLVIPRSTGDPFGISLNSLAFGGSFFAKTEKKLEKIKEIGLHKLLQEACFPPIPK